MIKITAPVRIDISAGWSDAAPFQNGFGGAVLNAAINLRVSATLGNRKLITDLNKVPPNSGLGTSGALRTVFLVASNPCLVKDRIDLIKRVHTLENAIIDQRAGFQDQAAAIFGGVNYWEFRKNGSIKRVPVSKKKAKHLYDRLVLVYTGESHLSANVHEKVFGSNNYMKHIFTIERMKENAKKMLKNITNENKMKELFGDTWYLQRSLHPDMETPNMVKLQEIAKGSFLAARATGAGGGGCMLFYTDTKNKLRRVLRENSRKVPGMEVLDFKFDYRGLELKNATC